MTGGAAPSPPTGGSPKGGGESFCLSAPQNVHEWIPKGHLGLASKSRALCREPRHCWRFGMDSPRASRCPSRGQRQGRENFPRSQRRDDQMPEQAKRARPGEARHAVDRLARMSGVGRREADAARGKFPLVKWSEKEKGKINKNMML